MSPPILGDTLQAETKAEVQFDPTLVSLTNGAGVELLVTNAWLKRSGMAAHAAKVNGAAVT